MLRFVKHGKSDKTRERPKSGPVVVTTRFNQNPLWLLRFKLLGIVAVCLVVVVGIVWGGVKILKTPHHTPPVVTKDVVSQEVAKAPTLTAEQKRTMTAVVRENATVVTVGDESMTVKLQSGTTLTLSTSKDTLYSSGNKGYSAERKDVKSGQDAIILYDTDKSALKSIWVKYDQQ